MTVELIPALVARGRISVESVPPEQPIRRVTDWELTPDAAAQAVVLLLMDEDRADTPVAYALSLPTAKQLADRLNEAVETCLEFYPEPETL